MVWYRVINICRSESRSTLDTSLWELRDFWSSQSSRMFITEQVVYDYLLHNILYSFRHSSLVFFDVIKETFKSLFFRETLWSFYRVGPFSSRDKTWIVLIHSFLWYFGKNCHYFIFMSYIIRIQKNSHTTPLAVFWCVIVHVSILELCFPVYRRRKTC